MTRATMAGMSQGEGKAVWVPHKSGSSPVQIPAPREREAAPHPHPSSPSTMLQHSVQSAPGGESESPWPQHHPSIPGCEVGTGLQS